MDRLDRRRAVAALRCTGCGVASLERVAVPAQDRVRAHQQQEVSQLAAGEVVEQAGEDGAVGIGEGGLADLALEDQQLVSKHQDLDVFVPLTHRQEPSSTTGQDAVSGLCR
ncbi:hypothetical protein [Streptomyces sp. NPDC046805]|uniref:hypothetical protein n=1 Tax=Streptomyces sp. NPDC046805 TaxID=3155134 RepID=UPI0033C156CE